MYFDENKASTDDPIERILKNYWLLAMAMIILIVYIVEFQTIR
jgi:hypothetical protein